MGLRPSAYSGSTPSFLALSSSLSWLPRSLSPESWDHASKQLLVPKSLLRGHFSPNLRHRISHSGVLQTHMALPSSPFHCIKCTEACGHGRHMVETGVTDADLTLFQGNAASDGSTPAQQNLWRGDSLLGFLRPVPAVEGCGGGWGGG